MNMMMIISPHTIDEKIKMCGQETTNLQEGKQASVEARNYEDRVRFVSAVLPFAPSAPPLTNPLPPAEPNNKTRKGVKGEPHIIAGCSTD